MKVFFTTTPRLREKYDENVQAIYSSIKQLGHQHTSDYLVKVNPDSFYTFNDKNQPAYYDEILESLRKADIVVFETSMHSIGVGMLLREALDLGKGVIALHMKSKYPFLLGGLKDDRLVIDEYTIEDVKSTLAAAFDYLSDKQDTRFNFFISPTIGNYLDWISKKKKLPRAVYLRRLIEEDMKLNKDYQG